MGCNELAFSGTGNILGAAASSMQKSLKNIAIHSFSASQYIFREDFFEETFFKLFESVSSFELLELFDTFEL